MIEQQFLIGLGFLIIAFVGMFFIFKNYLIKILLQFQQQSMDSIQQQMTLQHQQAEHDLEKRQQNISYDVKNLKEEILRYETMLKELEKDRERKFGQLETELKNASQTTANLYDQTNRLNNILSNVKLRGQWGERMAEDIIQHAGLIEGVNYQKQQTTESMNRPDFTFLLPNEHKVHMDVKFPLNNYLKMINASSDLEKESFEKEFFKNVKDRIKELQNRNYINPAENTLDFVLLFIPNEQVYALIQDRRPGILDESLNQKVVLCSPFNLYAMLAVVRQAYQNFKFEKNLQKVIKDIDLFHKRFEGFKKRFEDIGATLEKTQQTYEDIRSKNFKQIDTTVRRIEKYQKGQDIQLTKQTGDSDE